MLFADRVGLKTIHDRVAAFHREMGKRWAPAPLLTRLAEQGMTFRELDARQEAATEVRTQNLEVRRSLKIGQNLRP
jgi:hypothetical protein